MTGNTSIPFSLLEIKINNTNCSFYLKIQISFKCKKMRPKNYRICLVLKNTKPMKIAAFPGDDDETGLINKRKQSVNKLADLAQKLKLR